MIRTLTAALILSLMSMPAMAQKPKGKGGPTPVIVTIAAEKEFSDVVEAIGTLKANESVDIASTVTERVVAIKFDDNQRVKKGDILIEMDTVEERAELAEQKSFRAEAQRQVNRLTPLVKKGAASDSTLDENRSELLAAKARIDAIQSRLNERIITAPYDGVLGLRNISVGALAQPGVTLTTIDDISVMKLDFCVPELFLSALKQGLVIQATTQAFPDEVFQGTISSIDSRIDPVTRSIIARAIIDNEDGKLRPGLLMQVDLQKNTRQAIIIPEETLIADGPDNFVFVVTTNEENKKISQRRKVTLGERRFGEVEILDGLEIGEQIITHGIIRVRPGSEVTIKTVEKDNEPLTEMLNAKKGEDKK